jgi:predicted ArsR family transcriptional regulator
MPETVEIDSEWRDLSAAKRDILIMLARDGPLTGQGLAERIDRHEKRVYIHLPELRNEGLIGDDGDRNRHDNRLTVEGKALVNRAYVAPARELDWLDA